MIEKYYLVDRDSRKVIDIYSYDGRTKIYKSGFWSRAITVYNDYIRRGNYYIESDKRRI